MNILEITNQYSWFHTEDAEIKYILWKVLRCRAKNYFHNVRYKMKLWDGYDEFFKQDSGRFLTGLLPEVKLVLNKKNIQYEIKDNRGEFEWAVDKIDENFIEGIKLRDYQVDYVNKVIQNWRGLITSPTSSGKALSLDSLVYTPSGPKRMGDIKVGDIVCTPSGGTANVIGVYPQGEREIFRITFSNNDTVECCKEHLWKVNAIMDGWEGRVKDTQYLIDNCNTPSGRSKYCIDLPSQIYFEERVLKMSPYMMGALLGDSYFGKSLGFANIEEQIFNKIEQLISDDYKIISQDGINHRITKKINNPKKSNIYLEAIRYYGLAGKKSNNKFIPDDYKYNTIENRIELIRGLMDTDGYVNKIGYIEYCSCSLQLINDVKEVIESLGGLCRIRNKYPICTYKGERRIGQLSYILSIAIQNPSNLFFLERKKERCNNVPKRMRMIKRVIKSIDSVGVKPCQCILIDDPDHLYLTDHFIITHNTETMKAIIKSLPTKTPTLVLANKTSLIDQSYEDIKKMGIEGVGRLYGNKKEPNYITCATVQSAHLLKPILPKIKVLIVDEVHEMMSKVPKKIYNNLTNCCIRVGMSATAFKFGGKDESQKFEVKGYFGPVFLTDTTETGKLTTKELINRNIISSVKCIFFKIKEPKLPHEIYLNAVTKGIAENNNFHKLVADLVLKLDGRTLIIVERIEHGDRLQKMIPNSMWIKGEDDLDTRKDVIEKLKYEQENFVGIATAGIFTSGISCYPNNLINCCGGQAEHQIIQKFGRGLRIASDKKHLQYYDFIFEINEYLEKHSWNRVKVLEKEGHNVEVMDWVE